MSTEPVGVRPSVSGAVTGRRRFLRLSCASVALPLAGCLGGDGDRGTTNTTLDPERVTTTGGDGIEILVARLAIREADAGPRVYYRLRNAGDADATLALRTELHVDDGGTYEATAFLDVPAGDEMFVEYRIAPWTELTEAEAENVRRGNADFELYLNGERRQV